MRFIFGRREGARQPLPDSRGPRPSTPEGGAVGSPRPRVPQPPLGSLVGLCFLGLVVRLGRPILWCWAVRWRRWGTCLDLGGAAASSALSSSRPTPMAIQLGEKFQTRAPRVDGGGQDTSLMAWHHHCCRRSSASYYQASLATSSMALHAALLLASVTIRAPLVTAIAEVVGIPGLQGLARTASPMLVGAGRAFQSVILYHAPSRRRGRTRAQSGRERRESPTHCVQVGRFVVDREFAVPDVEIALRVGEPPFGVGELPLHGSEFPLGGGKPPRHRERVAIFGRQAETVLQQQKPRYRCGAERANAW